MLRRNYSSRSHASTPQQLVLRQVLRHLRQQSVLPSLLPQNVLPQQVALGIEDQFDRGGVREPGVALHFIFKLASAPAGIAGEQLDLARGGKGLAELDQVVQGMA